MFLQSYEENIKNKFHQIIVLADFYRHNIRICPTFLKFQSARFPSLPSVAALDCRKHFQCLNVCLNNKNGRLFSTFSGCEDKFYLLLLFCNNRRRVTAPLNFSVELLRKFLLHDLGSWSPTRIEVILSQNRSDAIQA